MENHSEMASCNLYRSIRRENGSGALRQGRQTGMRLISRQRLAANAAIVGEEEGKKGVRGCRTTEDAEFAIAVRLLLEKTHLREIPLYLKSKKNESLAAMTPRWIAPRRARRVAGIAGQVDRRALRNARRRFAYARPLDCATSR